MNEELEKTKIRLHEFIHNINLANKTIDDIKRDVNTALNHIDNSVLKEVTEKKIEELKEMKVDGKLFRTAVNFAIKILQEILEEK